MIQSSRLAATSLVALVVITGALARSNPARRSQVQVNLATRIADPKLPGGGARFGLHVEGSHSPVMASMEVLQAGVVVAKPWTGFLTDNSIQLISWDGLDELGNRCSTGSYTVQISTPGQPALDLPLDIVRLGVSEIEAQSSAAGNDEFPMVYFRKGSTYAYYSTPAIHEYANLAPAGEVSDLDQDSGEPRPVVAVHLDTDSPVLDGTNYETDTFNYPLAYTMGAAPVLELTLGSGGTAADGSPMAPGYPVPGFDLRCVLSTQGATVTSGPITPGGTATLSLPSLPAEVGRTDAVVVASWQCAPTGTSQWSDVPGGLSIPLRFYTLLGPPVWAAGAPNETRYAGPWVEVAEYVSTWKDVLAMPTYGQRKFTALFVRGFFGQIGGLSKPIEELLYDCPPLGGDGGNTHYFNSGKWEMDLSRLLNNHAKGVYVNCTDTMGATTTMLSMMGATGVQPVRLGSMSLKAIWGIGAPEYTTNLWGGGSHGFSYHHIVTDANSLTVSDTCMQLDEDGAPENIPGIPGWNSHRNWKDPVIGYNVLSSYNNTNKSLQALPGIY
jgi:hypothetical protein